MPDDVNVPKDRMQILRSWLDRDGLGLEIGPLHAPVAPKREGWRVETLDHADTETLRARYRGNPDVDAAAIQEVDHVSDGRPLTEVIGSRARYDWILASHVAEHVPDLLGFLLDCEALLKPAGRLVVALPDKRRCFDALRPLSTTGDVLQAHVERRTRHTPRAAFDFIARAVDFGGDYAWAEGQTGAVRLQHPLTSAFALFNALANTEQYHDIHGWVFVPSSFRLIVEELHSLAMCELQEVAFQTTIGIEFFAVLSKDGLGSGVTRQELVLQAAEEEVVGLRTLVNAGANPPN